MSLSIALTIIAIEIVVAAVMVATADSPRRRAQRLYRCFGVFAGCSVLWAIGLAGTLELFGSSPGIGTTIALSVLNVAAFAATINAYERAYGSDPA